MTNYHVIRGARTLTVHVPGKETFSVDSVLGYNIENDVAALQLSAGNSPPALYTEEADVAKVGDRVVAIGAPLGLESTVSEGIVSALRNTNGTHIIQTTAPISPGSSGGPLLNEFGRVIGLTTATIRNGENLNFVVSSVHIVKLLNRKRPLSILELLAETQVGESLPANTLSVPPETSFSFRLQ
jgi:S1-C subfamily serine protease